MQTILDVVVPIFAVIGLGFLAARTRLLAQDVGDALSKFVFAIAVPTLLFRTLATADFGGADPLVLWGVYFLGVAVTWASATILTRRVFKANRRVGVVAGLSASFSNTVFVALPAIQRAYGDEGLEGLFLIISVHLPTMMVIATLMMERAARGDAEDDGAVRMPTSIGSILKSVARNLLRNAIVVGILCGLAWRLTGLDLPRQVEEVAGLLGSTAGPVSLFAMGISLTRFGIRGDLHAVFAVSALSLILMPAIVYAAGLQLLPPLWLKVAVITAAAPAGINSYLLAMHFRSGERLAATTMLVSTILSVVTLTVWLAILG